MNDQRECKGPRVHNREDAALILLKKHEKCPSEILNCPKIALLIFST